MKNRSLHSMRFLRSLSWLLILFVLLTALAGCDAGQNDSSQEHPAIWEVQDSSGEHTIYLLGSIHAAEAKLYPMPRKIRDAFRSCDALAVEVDLLTYMEDAAKAMELTKYMVYLDGTLITDTIDEDLVLEIWDLLEAEEVEVGLPADYAFMIQPYTYLSLLTGVAVEHAGLSADEGVDLYFLQEAAKREMEVLEIESMDSQLQMLTSFSPTLQTYLLESALQVETAAEEMRELYNMWKIGDTDALTGMLGELPEEDADDLALLAELEEYNRLMITDRNDWMSDVAEGYLLEGKKVFYVVGALHMVGEDGIVQQLIDRGYQVTRL